MQVPLFILARGGARFLELHALIGPLVQAARLGFRCLQRVPQLLPGCGNKLPLAQRQLPAFLVDGSVLADILF